MGAGVAEDSGALADGGFLARRVDMKESAKCAVSRVEGGEQRCQRGREITADEGNRGTQR